MTETEKIHVLLEMRPALDGFAGIPQETRLLFRQLCDMPNVHVEGLLQSSLQFLHPGLALNTKKPADAAIQTNASRLHKQAKVILSLERKPTGKSLFGVVQYLKRRAAVLRLAVGQIICPAATMPLSCFRTGHFEEYIWQKLFSKTLAAEDYAVVTTRNYRVCTTPWNILQSVGLNTRRILRQPRYPVLDTGDVDILITQTPYPARVPHRTRIVVRYHDALAVFMPHAFANKERHLATHFYALENNVRAGAYFACVSEATRQDLLRLHPEVAERTVTIHNMVSHHYFWEEASTDSVPQIVRSRLNITASEARPEFRSLEEKNGFYKLNLSEKPFKYLLMVSTIEPRKNHSRLVAAWEIIRAKVDPTLKLVIVGSLGWDVGPIMKEMRTWIDQGELFVLNNVPASDLRVLYRNAAVTVCPSVAEGFDFSGVESMRSGGITIASDIPIHREVYLNAAEYFEPHSTTSLVDALRNVLYGLNSLQMQSNLRTSGQAVSMRYLPEAILPKWDRFLKQVSNRDIAIETLQTAEVLEDNAVT